MQADIEGGSNDRTDNLLEDPWATPSETEGTETDGETYEFTGDMAGDSWGDNYEDVTADPDNRNPSGPVEEWLASGTSRTVYDWVMDYEGEWAGEEDRRDLVGPSFYAGNLLDASSEEPAFQWRNDAGAENDPTHPDNRPDPEDWEPPDINVDLPPWAPYAAAGVGLLLLLVVLRPYASMGATAAEVAR